MVGNEVVDELKATLAPAHIAIALPVAVNCFLEILDRLTFVPLPRSQPGKLQVDYAAALLRLQQRVEVNGGFLNPACGRERLSQLDRCTAIVRRIAEGRAGSVHRRLRRGIPHSLIPPLQPSGGQGELDGGERLPARMCGNDV